MNNGSRSAGSARSTEASQGWIARWMARERPARTRQELSRRGEKVTRKGGDRIFWKKEEEGGKSVCNSPFSSLARVYNNSLLFPG